jgi:hypothetical protein
VAPWKLPLVVAAIAVPIIAAFYAGGPGAGLFAGALVAVGLLVVAARQRPQEAIGEAPSDDHGRPVLIVVSCALEDAAVIREVAAAVDGGDRPAEEAEVMVLSPARIGFLDRWASDLEGARQAAQQRLVIAVASLAKAGIDAEARVGDEDLVQAVEDQTRRFAATAVILVTEAVEDDPAAADAATELRSRLRAEFRWIALSGPATR